MPKQPKPDEIASVKPVAIFVQRERVSDGRPVTNGNCTVFPIKGMAHWRCVIEFDDGSRRQCGLVSPVEPTAETVLNSLRRHPIAWRQIRP